MISFDQVLLLEEKVESAVKKIEQLNAENAALRSKVAELSNALNAKTEQFSSFQNDQSKIEEGILKALSRLNAVENVVLSAAGAVSASATQSAATKAVQNESQAEQNEQLPQTEQRPQSEQNAPQAEQIAQGEQAEQILQSEPIAQDSVENEEFESVTENPAPSEAQTPSFEGESAGVEPQNFGEPQMASSVENIENPVQNEIAQSEGDSLTPDIDFEFGDSDAQVDSPAENANPAHNSDSESESNQPMFDIF